MSGRERDEEFRDLLHGSATTPIRWDRVNAIARRRSILALCGLVALALLLTVVLIATTVAGKSALDPSFSPPILSHASVSMVVGQPRFGRGLTRPQNAGTASVSSATVPDQLGYRLKASVEVEGLKGERLITSWRFIGAGRGGTTVVDPAQVRRIIPRSNDEEETLRRWVPQPQHSGSYIAAVNLRARNGEEVASARSAPFYVVGDDCCAAYRTKTYEAILPKGWRLEENYAPNPGSRFVTLARGPYDNSVVIDTSPHQSGGTLDKTNGLEGLLANSGEGYRRLDRNLHRVDRHLVVEWSYEVEGDAFTDILFSRGPNGYAVLGRSDQAHFRETRDLTRAIARSVKPLG